MNGAKMPKSIASMYGQIIDCRKLIFCGNYFALTDEQRRELTLDFNGFVNHLMEQIGYTQWKFNNSPTGNLRSSLDKNVKSYFTMTFSGDFISEFVTNKKSFKEYEYLLFHAPSPEHYEIEALGYKEYYSKNISIVENSPVRYEQAIYRLFDESGYLDKGVCVSHDYQGSFVCFQLLPVSNLFYGSFFVEIQLFCIEDNLEYWLQQMADTSTSFSEKYGNINVRIEINTNHQTFSKYFGNNIENYFSIGTDPSLLFFAENVYLTGVGIYNIISSKSLCLSSKMGDWDSIVARKKLSNGNMAYWLPMPPNEVGVEQLKIIKKGLYHLLLPSHNLFPNGSRLRNRWESIPIIDEEIHATDLGIHFSHCGTMDIERLMNVPGIVLNL